MYSLRTLGSRRGNNSAGSRGSSNSRGSGSRPYPLRDSVPDVRGKDYSKSSEGEDSLPDAVAGYGFGGEEREVGGMGDV